MVFVIIQHNSTQYFAHCKKIMLPTQMSFTEVTLRHCRDALKPALGNESGPLKRALVHSDTFRKLIPRMFKKKKLSNLPPTNAKLHSSSVRN